ncbi:MAG: hypothetical protein NTW21_06325 [Verrucomicrobia bacterium]|nr:hypothetical protein [Verrucomicrobiota bacterium]
MAVSPLSPPATPSNENITWHAATRTVIYRSKRHHPTKRNLEIFEKILDNVDRIGIFAFEEIYHDSHEIPHFPA